jgi:hypothetical protein
MDSSQLVVNAGSSNSSYTVLVQGQLVSSHCQNGSSHPQARDMAHVKVAAEQQQHALLCTSIVRCCYVALEAAQAAQRGGNRDLASQRTGPARNRFRAPKVTHCSWTAYPLLSVQTYGYGLHASAFTYLAVHASDLAHLQLRRFCCQPCCVCKQYCKRISIMLTTPGSSSSTSRSRDQAACESWSQQL